MKKNSHSEIDVVLIGAGIMSATLGVLLKELQPNLSILVVERLDEIAAESSDAWNNAGTGHTAFCELNYTPQKEDKSIDISKALKIASSFQNSKQFWAYLVEQKKISNPNIFINSIPHISFVWGADNVWYLRQRHAELTKYPLFKDMAYSEKWNVLEKWMPLIMNGRDPGSEVAATKMEGGTDVNFGELTRAMFNYLKTLDGVRILLKHEVRDITKKDNGQWLVEVKDLKAEEENDVTANFVFIGAGGGSLPLLEKSDIKEAEGYGGFPVSGQWLKCNNEKVIEQHAAKVYGKASVGAPPMSVPHLDTRIINGKKELLFGPFAGFSTKFLKNGSFWDLAGSLELDNLFPMLSAGAHNLPLTKYLINQASQSPEDRLKALQEYLPEARLEDWELVVAGQRVQVIKKDEEHGGVLEFGTEIVCAGDGSIAALLGASPGASTSVSVMLDVIKKCFKTQFPSPEWQAKLKQMIPNYEKSFNDDEMLCTEVTEKTNKVLELD
jgi:malate dehydrogenase (quinone)